MSRSELAFRMVGVAGAGLLRLLGRTFRLRIGNDGSFRRFRKEGRPVIFAFWHSGILPLTYVHRGEGVAVLVSRHADGEYIARVVERMGFRTARGSSTRGGVQGLRALLRHLREGRDVAVTPDGPKGPARVFKPGVLVLARLTGAPVIPVGVGAHRAWTLDSWDGFLVPKPFGRMDVRYGEPYLVPRDVSDKELAGHARRLEEILNELGNGPVGE